MAYLNKVEIIHETTGKYLNYEFYSADKMTDKEIYEEFDGNLSVITDRDEIDAIQCAGCEKWTEDYQQHEASGLNLCTNCFGDWI